MEEKIGIPVAVYKSQISAEIESFLAKVNLSWPTYAVIAAVGSRRTGSCGFGQRGELMLEFTDTASGRSSERTRDAHHSDQATSGTRAAA